MLHEFIGSFLAIASPNPQSTEVGLTFKLGGNVFVKSNAASRGEVSVKTRET